MTLPQLAKLVVETYIREGRVIEIEEAGLSLFSQQRAGVFVTIKKGQELRGCLGTYLPTKKNIIEETLANALAAATQDSRFKPVSEEELPELTYTVYVLDEPEAVAGLDDLDPRRYGIIVRASDNPQKTGLLLPDLAGVDTVEKQLVIACQKAGINPERESIVTYRFEVEKYE